MEITRIILIALTGAILSMLMKNIDKNISLYIVIATSLIIVLSVIDSLVGIFDYISSIYDKAGYGGQFIAIIIKVLAVAYVVDFTSQLCKDAGEGSIASKVELAGKIAIFYLAIPILSAILDMIETLL